MVTSPGPGLFSHQRFLTVLRFQPVAVKMSRYKASVLPKNTAIDTSKTWKSLNQKTWN